jgi:hypothetical protein
MPQPLFDVYFRGALLPGTDPAAARERLASLFGLSATELERLFGGIPVCVKRAVDVDTASDLRGRFRDAGALVDIRPTDATAKPGPPPPISADVEPPPALGAAQGAAGWTLTAPGTGSVADSARPAAAAPLPDVNRITLGPEGGDASDAAAPPPYVIDTSHLSVAPARTGTLEDCRQEKPARPIGDISHLALSDD